MHPADSLPRQYYTNIHSSKKSLLAKRFTLPALLAFLLVSFWFFHTRQVDSAQEQNLLHLQVPTAEDLTAQPHNPVHHPSKPFGGSGHRVGHHAVPFGRPPKQASPHPPVADTPSPDVITFALLMWDEVAAREGAVLIKSILMYTSRPLQFHIVCNAPARSYLDRRVSLLQHPTYDVTFRFYQPSWQDIIDRIDREGSLSTTHSAGHAGLMKLFLQELLPDTVTKAIYVDVDAFFISDPLLLWQQFNLFERETAVSMPSHPDLGTAAWLNADRICSCVMLLDLQKLRDMHLMDSIYYRRMEETIIAKSGPAFEALLGQRDPVTGHYENIALGDQTFWWAIVSTYPELYRPLSYDWEVSSCVVDAFNTRLGNDDTSMESELATQHDRIYKTSFADQAVLPKILHFNCLSGPVYYEWVGWDQPEQDTQNLNQRWGASVRYHVGYKWLWLNQRNDNQTKVLIETVDPVHFADESIYKNSNPIL